MLLPCKRITIPCHRWGYLSPHVQSEPQTQPAPPKQFQALPVSFASSSFLLSLSMLLVNLMMDIPASARFDDGYTGKC